TVYPAGLRQTWRKASQIWTIHSRRGVVGANRRFAPTLRCSAFLMSGVSKCFGGHAGLTAEDSAEVAAVGKTDIRGNVGDGLRGFLKQPLRLIDPVSLEIGDGSGSQFLAETVGQVVFGYTDVLGDIAARDGLGIVLMNVAHRHTN